MTAFAHEALHIISAILAALLMIFAVGFIAGVCICTVCRPQSNGYAQRYRDLAGRMKQERKRTTIITPDHQDTHIVGDVPHFHQAQYPASRANARRGEG